MNEYKEYTARTVDDAITEACESLVVTSDRLDYEVVTEGSLGFLGMGVKPAVIRARIKEEKVEEEIVKEEASFVAAPVKEVKAEAVAAVEEAAKTNEAADKDRSSIDSDALISEAESFLADIFKAMDMPVTLDLSFDSENLVLNADLSGADMGVLIGKRGQTLDSLQYLLSLVVNKETDTYVHVKVDTENYRQRRKATLENLAKNIAYKVRKSRTSVSLEPMNPYERRIIHSALQADRYVTTHSEGEEPYRRVVVTLKK
ncbi:RNA-binding cell elongation regulator Jag/EloR [Butyrivibrio sp. MC2013]|uniref:RNA-binding cell elongation regulator Jag/EloR n=1 Tax=Butyrivibrio sp. MC2013 TaxID=1280686 RepID=UPI0003F9085B|nr:RNA-binding cell elongation regulator Jag/EloR [Butyrivibrio sp. MC2013]